MGKPAAASGLVEAVGSVARPEWAVVASGVVGAAYAVRARYLKALVACFAAGDPSIFAPISTLSINE